MRESAPAVIVNGVPVPLEGEKNLLEVVRKAGIDLPTLCYHEDLSVYGGCRQCVVETERGQIVAACSTPPQDGLRIRTHSPRLRKIRRMALELTLANHDRSCTTRQSGIAPCKIWPAATVWTTYAFPSGARTASVICRPWA